jgi:hypothetical protein
MSVIIGYDVTHTFIDSAPRNALLALYVTGSDGIPATQADLLAHPGCLRIDQTPLITAADITADYFDVENGAITIAEIPAIIKDAIGAYHRADRPGQRFPSIYMSASNVTPVVNSLIKAGITGGPGLIVANWNLNQGQAAIDVQKAAGPFPVNGMQFRNAGPFDINVFSAAWVSAVSRKLVPVAKISGVVVTSDLVAHSVTSTDGRRTWS